jgi:hypothetical protein
MGMEARVTVFTGLVTVFMAVFMGLGARLTAFMAVFTGLGARVTVFMGAFKDLGLGDSLCGSLYGTGGLG